jgi:hypothetical protein
MVRTVVWIPIGLDFGDSEANFAEPDLLTQ